MALRDGGDGRVSKGKRTSKHKKVKPIRTESWTIRQIFKENDFSYIDDIAKKKRKSNRGCKGFKASALFSALLLMYLRNMDSLLELVRFLDKHREWLKFLNLKRKIGGVEKYVVPDRTTFNKFVGRLGVDGVLEIFIQMVTQMIEQGIIKGERISIDATIIAAWFKDKTYYITF